MVDTDKKYTPPEKYKPKAFNPNKKPEKVSGFTVLSFVALLIAFIAKYFIDFLLLPNLFPSLYPYSVGAIIIWIIETIIFCALTIKFISGFGPFYIIAILQYAIPIAFWPHGVFGFGTEIPAIAGALIAYFATRIIERIVMWFYVIIGFITM